MLTKEQRDEILRLAAEVIKKPSDTWESFGRLQNFTKYLDSITVPEGWKVGNELAPFHPSASHVEPGYRDGLNDCYRAMLAAAPKAAPGDAWRDLCWQIADTLECTPCAADEVLPKVLTVAEDAARWRAINEQFIAGRVRLYFERVADEMNGGAA
mgnify:CR=1 FL=1